MYPTLCKVSYYDEDAHIIRHENILIYADTFAEAAEKMESYYGNVIDTLSISMYGEGGLWRVSEDQVESIIQEVS